MDLVQLSRSHPSHVVRRFATTTFHDMNSLILAKRVSECLVAAECPYAFRRTEGLVQLLSLLSSLPPSADGLIFLRREDLLFNGPSSPRNIIATLMKNLLPGPIDGLDDELIGIVTWREKELILRIIQGVCTISPSQRRNVSLTKFFEVSIERMAGLGASIEPHSTNFVASNSGNGSLGQSKSQRDDNIPADHIQMYRVALANIDAIEAACHFSPANLWSFTKLGGVAAFFSILRNSTHPHIVRAAVADTLCTLVNEVGSVVDWIDRPSAVRFDNAVKEELKAVVASKPHEFALSVGDLFAQLGSLREHRGTAVWGQPELDSQFVTFKGKDVASQTLRAQKAREERFETFLTLLLS